MYHIFYRPKNQKGSSLLSIENPDARRLWESMVSGANRTGVMRHPATQQEIEYATLQYGGQDGQGGMTCQRWTPQSGLERIHEPEPPAPVAEIPEQPVPPGPEVDEVIGVEQYTTEPIQEESVSEE